MTPKPPPRRWAPWLFLGLLSLFPNLAMAQGGESAAPVNPEFLIWQKAKAEAEATFQTNFGIQDSALEASGVERKLGYEPSPLDLSHIRGPVPLKNTRFGQEVGGGLPAIYDLRASSGVTAIRNQDPFGTCWAFAAMASLESTQRKAGLGTFDLSEWHLAWYAYNNLNTTLVSFTKRTAAFGNDATFDQGGNNWKATAILARGTGAVDEAASPYQGAPYPLSSLPKGTEPVSVQLQESLYLGSDFDSTTMKTAVQNLGAVSISIYWANNYYYDDGTNHTYRYTNKTTNSNHAVNIVGWNDSYPAANFPSGNRPASNGAWIVRNSWGSGWGDGGYFYLSYDSAINDGVAYVSGENLYPQIYQYDPLGWINGYGNTTDTAWFSNIFTAKMTEDIGAVSFYAGAPLAEYDISIRGDVTGNPSTGTALLETQAGTLDAPGYRTVTLGSPVRVTAGSKFAVIVKLRTPNFKYPIPVEYPEANYSDKARAVPGQSFRHYEGGAWGDMTSVLANTNVCLKAFSTPSPIAVSASSRATTGKAGQIASVVAQTGCTYTWTITNGKITLGATTRSITYTAGTVGTTTVTCKVKSSAGTSATGSADIEVIPAPVAVITAGSPVTAGAPGRTASVASQDDMSYAWTITNGTINSGGTSHAIAYTPTKVGTVTLKCVVTDLTGTAATGTKTITAIALPNTTITAATYATDKTAGLAASVPLQTGCTYAWTMEGNGSLPSITNKNTVVYNAGSTGSLTLKCTVTNAAGTGVLGSKLVTVVPAPSALIETETLVVAGRSGIVATMPSQAGTFTWSITGGTLSSGQGSNQITYKAGAAGTATLKCTVKNQAGTPATATQAVTVVATIATIKAASPVTTGLSGCTAAVPATAGATYVWSDVASIVGQGTPSITYTAGAVGTTATVKCIVTVGATPTTGTKVISVIAAPVATITAADRVTAGKTGLIASVPAQPGCTYAWTLLGGKITAGATTRTITYTAGAVGEAELTCVVKNAAGTAISAEKDIDVLAAPLATITAPSTITAFEGGWTASVPMQKGNFTWVLTGVTPDGSVNDPTITFTAGKVGTATLKCTVINGAGTVATSTKTLTIVPAPKATITAPATIVVGPTGKVASVPVQTGCSYTWSIPSGTATIKSGQGTRSIIFTSPVANTFEIKCVVKNAAGSEASNTVSVAATAP